MTSVSTEHVSPKTLRKVIVAAAIGNFVEWFDFAVYGFLATTIAQQFFPSGDASAASLPGAKARARLSGSGDLRLGVSQELDATLSGSGDLAYSGRPKLQSKVSGSGELINR